MDLAALQARIRPLLSDVSRRENLLALTEALTDPAPHTWDRPWLPNRYVEADVPGIQSLWDEVARALTPLLAASDELMRAAGLLLLLYTPSEAVLPQVEAQLGHPDPAVVVPAIHVLAESRAREALPKVLERLTSPRFDVRTAAAAAVGRLGGADQARTLAALMAVDPHDHVRYWAARSMGEIGGPEAQQLLLATLEAVAMPPLLWQGIREALGGLGADVTDLLLKRAQEGQGIGRVRAIEALANQPAKHVEPVLRAAMRAEDRASAVAAAWALAARGNPSGLGYLSENLNDSNPGVMIDVASRLASLGHRVGLLRVLQYYFDPAHRDRVRASLTIVPIPLRAELLTILREPDLPIARAAADLAGAWGLAEAAPLLTGLLEGDDPQLAFAAAVALCRLERERAAGNVGTAVGRLRDPRVRLKVVSDVRDLWRPLPEALVAPLWDDPCALVVIVGAEVLVNSDASDVAAQLGALLDRERRRLSGELPQLPDDQNAPLLSASEVQAFLASQEQPLLRAVPAELASVDAVFPPNEGWGPSEAICRVVLAGLVAGGAHDQVPAIALLLELDVAVLRFRALQAIVALVGPAPVAAVAELGADKDARVQALWSRAKALAAR